MSAARTTDADAPTSTVYPAMSVTQAARRRQGRRSIHQDADDHDDVGPGDGDHVEVPVRWNVAHGS